ncbi:hypothetical protein Tco_0201088 [Tanacetum coccineum]
MELCTNLQQRVLDLEQTKTTQANEIASLKKRLKKLEKKRSSRTHKLKRLYKVGLRARVKSSRYKESLGEDASKQGRINAIDANDDITLVSVQDDADKEMFNVDDLNGEEVFVAGQSKNVVEEVVNVAKVSTAATTATTTTDDDGKITLAQALIEMKSTKPKVKGIVFQEPSTTTTTISSQLSLQDKEWDDIQAKIKADHELAQRLQAEEQEELSFEEKEKLFQQLLEQRRKHFATKSAEEKRNKPPTQAQQRKIMCTYLKNMEGKKLKDLKNKSFDSIQKMFDRAFKRVKTFVNFRTYLVEGSSKRAREELEQESTKKQKVDEDKDTVELQSLMEVIPDEEDVAIDVIPLATKPPTIVDWKIHKEGKKSYFQIIRADRSSKMYRVFSQMLKSFDKQDLEDLYKLFAIQNDLHDGRKEISPYTTYNYRYAEKEAPGVNAANEEVSTAELVSTAYLVTPITEWVFGKLLSVVADNHTWDPESAHDVAPNEFQDVLPCFLQVLTGALNVSFNFEYEHVALTATQLECGGYTIDLSSMFRLGEGKSAAHFLESAAYFSSLTRRTLMLR